MRVLARYRIHWSDRDRSWLAESRATPGIIGLGETPMGAIAYAQIAETWDHFKDTRPYYQQDQPRLEYAPLRGHEFRYRLADLMSRAKRKRPFPPTAHRM